ncbi:MAG TPA: TonB family protein [Candidatus Marinimicrobia bacterium]|nr:TonB family protein [Candidatus Neomarinimicrobiota bacterium]HIB32332.1 TonB family protein [Candidatus Neomarinimicrobiota bacterium]
MIQTFVDEKGHVQGMSVLKGISNTGLNEAVMTAIKMTKFKSAKQLNRAVDVWISNPVNFQLNGY